MILVDTSVWIDFFRGKDLKVINKLNFLLDNDMVVMCYPIKLELLSGALNKELNKLDNLLSILPSVPNSDINWKIVENNIKLARKKGKRFGIMDLIIAFYASTFDLAIWSLDKDFEEMNKLGIVNVWN